ncbi:rifampin ADP-ribosylating transferase [Pedobacter sp. CAN_A7]|uniref:NAD(+)--rifampin ADP-ribosyltransferase n=1 Tax=Pedobacter sp. CAN_A7 TaxID=2787722 RepID=UPI0018CBEEAC
MEQTTLYHGTKANLHKGDLISPGFSSNYGKRNKAKFVYFSATLEAAAWGAELPTKSYRTASQLRVTGEVKDWKRHSPEQLKAMKDHLEVFKQQGIEGNSRINTSYETQS